VTLVSDVQTIATRLQESDFLFVFWMSSETEKFNGEKIPDGDAELVGDIIPTSVTVEEQREHDLQAI